MVIPIPDIPHINWLGGIGYASRHLKSTSSLANGQDAEELIALADSIFDYLYVIPAEVARRRARQAGSTP